LLLDELFVWAKLDDLYRSLTPTSPAWAWRGVRTELGTEASWPAKGAAWRMLRAYSPVVEAPRMDARRSLGQWLVRRRTAGGSLRGA
jgi:hypothetical protein